MTERDMLDRLLAKYGRLHRNGPWVGPRHIVAEHVRLHPERGRGWKGERVADFMAVDTWRSGRYALIGVEVKCSRSDFLAELRDPNKAGAFLPYVDHWWLAVADARFVRDDELPADWGLLTAHGRGLRVVRPAPLLHPIGTPPALLAGFARAVQQTASRAPSAAALR